MDAIRMIKLNPIKSSTQLGIDLKVMGLPLSSIHPDHFYAGGYTHHSEKFSFALNL
jgi:hypothetical protein